MNYVLILWLTCCSNQQATTNGSITTATFDTDELCINALASVRQRARNIGGLCIQQSTRPTVLERR